MAAMSENLSDVAACLNQGGVALLPTDTVFGLAARPDHADAVRRIFDLKDRPSTVNLPLLAPSRAAIETLGAIINDPAARLLASDLMPGALTLVLGIDPRRAPSWLNGRTECAVRIPKEARVCALLEMTGPLCATSANLHGAGNLRDVAAILAQLHGAPDIVLTGSVASEIASTVVNCQTDPPRIEREGQVAAAAIAEVLSDD